MEERFPLFDPNDETARQEERLREYYEEFSAFSRKKLLSRNIIRPTNVYDVLYPEARALMISKNTPFDNNLEENARIIRDKLIAKIVTEETSLEKISEDFRNSMIARAKIHEDKDRLLRDGDSFRKNLISKNNQNIGDLEKDSNKSRQSNLAKNKINPSYSKDIESDNKSFRENSISKNITKEQDLLSDSNLFRKNDIHKNVSKSSDIENDSIEYRNKNINKNSENKTSNLDDLSSSKRQIELSKNNNKEIDLESISSNFRKDDLSKNVPKEQDLLSDSNIFRKNDIKNNVPNNSELSKDSELLRRNNLSKNKNKDSNIEIDSVLFRTDDLSANAPSTRDLETDSVVFRTDDLASNIPSTSNLEIDSVPFRTDDLSANVSLNSNLVVDSIDFRENNIASNVPFKTDLLNDSETFRDNLISKNDGFGLIGLNVQGAGTSAFLGISKVFTQGILLRQLLLSKNKPNNSNLLENSTALRESNVIKSTNKSKPNQWILGVKGNTWAGNEYTSSSENFKLAETQVQNSKNSLIYDDFYREVYSEPLQKKYGTSVNGDNVTSPLKLNNGYYSTDTISPTGGNFINSNYNLDSNIFFGEGTITGNIQKYNLERNAFSMKGFKSENLSSTKQSLEGELAPGFQDLISKTIGSFKAVLQTRTITTPSSVIESNEGAYFKGGNKETDLLRPLAEGAKLGSAESMMAKTVVGNPFEDDFFVYGERGVSHVIDVIRKSGINGENLAGNYKYGNMPGGNDKKEGKVFITTVNSKEKRVSRQKYTIKNPYAPEGAGRLTFKLNNYASDEEYYFPAYIKSFQNTESASWNATNFLGRPEAVYTYNNSSRDASITFYVLTDYGQNVTLGTDWSKEDTPKVGLSSADWKLKPKHFTDGIKVVNNEKKLKVGELEKKNEELKIQLNQRLEKNKEVKINSSQVTTAKSEISGSDIATIQAQAQSDKAAQQAQEKAQESTVSSDNQQTDELSQGIGSLLKEIAKVEAEIALEKFKAIGEYEKSYSEVTNSLTSKNTYATDVMEDKPSPSKERILNMIQYSMFQPAYFSGDKVDFVRRMEFLSKMTRPKSNDSQSNTGFSFTKPPICHIQLGTWWNHDIVVNSVSYNYDNAPWTLEDTKHVQPMWAEVTISFNIIGAYGDAYLANSRPPLAGDDGGMYSPMVKSK